MRSPNALQQSSNGTNGSRLVDVRDLDEFAAVHVEGALCVPLPRLLNRASHWSLQDQITLICDAGQRAREAADQLKGVGFDRITVIDGGTKARIKAGVPVVRGRRRIPLQRQVFVGAGLVILTGLLLSLVHPTIELISWFAAGSMVVAGITGLCPMARILALIPWNRPGGSPDGPTSSSCTLQGACP